jgi:hypothetical protein
MGARAREGMDLGPLEGKTIDFWVESARRNVQAIVVTADSKAKKAGYDVMMMTCSDRCAKELQDALIADGIKPRGLT